MLGGKNIFSADPHKTKICGIMVLSAEKRHGEGMRTNVKVPVVLPRTHERSFTNFSLLQVLADVVELEYTLDSKPSASA